MKGILPFFLLPILLFSCDKGVGSFDFRDIEEYPIYFESKGSVDYFADISSSEREDGNYVFRRFNAREDTSYKENGTVLCWYHFIPSKESQGNRSMRVCINFSNIYLLEGSYELDSFEQFREEISSTHASSISRKGIIEEIIYGEAYHNDTNDGSRNFFLSKSGSIDVNRISDGEFIVEFEITFGERETEENNEVVLGSEVKIKGRYITGTNYEG